jgi:hypothetical protein
MAHGLEHVYAPRTEVVRALAIPDCKYAGWWYRGQTVAAPGWGVGKFQSTVGALPVEPCVNWACLTVGPTRDVLGDVIIQNCVKLCQSHVCYVWVVVPDRFICVTQYADCALLVGQRGGGQCLVW